jgi:Ca2+-binding RTX toxin-like protein
MGSNARLGKSHYLVAEADESDRSFLKLSPILSVVTNVDREHMDCYSDMDDVENTFIEFMDRVPFYGMVVVCNDDDRVRGLIPRVQRRVMTYGMRDGSDAIEGGSSTDTLVYPTSRTTPVNVTVGSGNFNDGGIEDQAASGRRDTVHGDIEVVAGTPQADLIAGDSSSETLIGGPGNDVLNGNRGNDTLLGLEGDDVIVGSDGSDLLRGWTGADRLFGGRGNDRVSGGPDGDLIVGNHGHDVLKGKGGIDFLRAKDGSHDFRIKCQLQNRQV